MIKIKKEEPTQISLYRKRYVRKGYELVNISTLCEYKLGTSGWCNDFNEPSETIHHIQVWYRDEQVATIGPDRAYPIDDKKYAVFTTNYDDFTGADFIIFKMCTIK